MEILEEIKAYILRNIYYIIVVLLVSFNIGISFYGISLDNKESSSEVEIENNYESTKEETLSKREITVDIKGMVKNPGLYILDSDANVNDLIKMAGGIKSGGTTANINLSKKLTDQMVVIVSSVKDLNDNQISQVIKCPGYNIDTCNADNQVVAIVENTENSNNNNNIDNLVPSNKVSINYGTKEQLMTLSGIGESKALAIISYRNDNGFFENLEDLMSVSGIGEATFVKIKEDITL